MNSIDEAIAAFEAQPNDVNAHLLQLEATQKSKLAFFDISDGIFPEPELCERLDRSEAVLSNVRKHTEDTRRFWESIFFHKTILRERNDGNRKEVQRMLEERMEKAA